MDLLNFYRMLFVVLGIIGIYFILQELIEFIRCKRYQKYMYHHLNGIWSLFVKIEDDQ